jgi:hypothetical protein
VGRSRRDRRGRSTCHCSLTHGPAGLRDLTLRSVVASRDSARASWVREVTRRPLEDVACELPPRFHTELPEHPVQVVLDGGRADEQPCGHLGVGRTLRHELRDLRLLGRVRFTLDAVDPRSGETTVRKSRQRARLASNLCEARPSARCSLSVARAIPVAMAIGKTAGAALQVVGMARSNAKLAWTYENVYGSAIASWR